MIYVFHCVPEVIDLLGRDWVVLDLAAVVAFMLALFLCLQDLRQISNRLLLYGVTVLVTVRTIRADSPMGLMCLAGLGVALVVGRGSRLRGNLVCRVLVVSAGAAELTAKLVMNGTLVGGSYMDSHVMYYAADVYLAVAVLMMWLTNRKTRYAIVERYGRRVMAVVGLVAVAGAAVAMVATAGLKLVRPGQTDLAELTESGHGCYIVSTEGFGHTLTQTGGELELGSFTGGTEQMFTIEPSGNYEYVYIRSAGEGTRLTAKTDKHGTLKLVMKDENKDGGQLWLINDLGGGRYTIESYVDGVNMEQMAGTFTLRDVTLYDNELLHWSRFSIQNYQILLYMLAAAAMVILLLELTYEWEGLPEQVEMAEQSASSYLTGLLGDSRLPIAILDFGLIYGGRAFPELCYKLAPSNIVVELLTVAVFIMMLRARFQDLDSRQTEYLTYLAVVLATTETIRRDSLLGLACLGFLGLVMLAQRHSRQQVNAVCRILVAITVTAELVSILILSEALYMTDSTLGQAVTGMGTDAAMVIALALHWLTNEEGKYARFLGVLRRIGPILGTVVAAAPAICMGLIIYTKTMQPATVDLETAMATQQPVMIADADNRGMAMTLYENNIMMATAPGTDEQEFTIIPTGNDKYVYIVSNYTGQIATAQTDDKASGMEDMNQLIMGSYLGNETQLWLAIPAEDGTISIESYKSLYNMVVLDRDTEDGVDQVTISEDVDDYHSRFILQDPTFYDDELIYRCKYGVQVYQIVIYMAIGIIYIAMAALGWRGKHDEIQ